MVPLYSLRPLQSIQHLWFVMVVTKGLSTHICFIYGLLDDAVSNSDSRIEWLDNTELKRTWKEVVVTHLRCHPIIYRGFQTPSMKATNNVGRRAGVRDWDLKLKRLKWSRNANYTVVIYGFKTLVIISWVYIYSERERENRTYACTYKAIDPTIDLSKKSVRPHILSLKTTQQISTGFGVGV
jgi:hypothetical protein